MNLTPSTHARKQARAHHFLPAFYLAGFTLSGTHDGRLWALDRERGKAWPTTPLKVGHRRDFYRIDLAGIERDAVESRLERIESRTAPVLRKICSTRLLPSGEDYRTLLSFVALQAVRVPHFRRFLEEKMTCLARHRATVALSSVQLFEQVVEEMRLRGKEIPASISRKSLLAFLKDEGRSTVEISREATINHMFDMAGALVPVLGRRNWSILFSQEADVDFICSDQPVLLWAKPPALPFLGFGTADEILIPLDRHTVLVGILGGESRSFEANRLRVGLLNQLMLDKSSGNIYSSRNEFVVTTRCRKANLRPAGPTD